MMEFQVSTAHSLELLSILNPVMMAPRAIRRGAASAVLPPSERVQNWGTLPSEFSSDRRSFSLIRRPASHPMPILFTIGHSTRPVGELVEMLKGSGVKLLIDVRTVPRSRTNPQYNREALELGLPAQHGLGYLYLGKELGGLRKRDKSSELNSGWDNDSFRGYADFMQTPPFLEGIQQLMDMAQAQGPAAIMCAEVVHFRCHRSLISDALLIRGWEVLHLITKGKPPTPHKLTRFAKVEGERITYPAYPHTRGQKGGGKKAQQAVAGAKQQSSSLGVGFDEDAQQPKISAVFKHTRSARKKQRLEQAEPAS